MTPIHWTELNIEEIDEAARPLLVGLARGRRCLRLGNKGAAAGRVFVSDEAAIAGESQFTLGAGDYADAVVARVGGVVESTGNDFPGKVPPVHVLGVGFSFDPNEGVVSPAFAFGDFGLGAGEDMRLRGWRDASRQNEDQGKEKEVAHGHVGLVVGSLA